MTRETAARLRAAIVVLAASAALAGCASSTVTVTKVRLSERECLARAMYFESNRSSDAGMLAVGTVVMNRVKSGKYGATVCEVVGARRQFAPGVLTKPMADRGAPRARRVADAVLAGRRHPGVQNAQFFHTAGYKFPYNNMRYVLVAGGNAFYDKRKPPKAWWGGEGRWGPPPAPTERIDGGEIMVAGVEVEDDGPAPAAPKRAYETQVAAVETPRARRGGSSGGIAIYEPPPSQQALPARRPAPTVVASLDEPVPANRAERRAVIREDNGLREEDRWRDQDLAEEQGRAPASDDDWRDRRDRTIETAPIPVFEPAPAPRAARSVRTARAQREDDAGYDAPEPAAAPEPRPSRPARVARAPQPEIYDAPEPVAAPEPRPARNVQVASRQRTVETRARPVEADPAALGWNAGPQPVETRSEADMGGYQPLSRAADDGYGGAADRRTASRPKSRSYGGVELGEGFR